MLDRLRRITDLFIEGTELSLGSDADGPVVVWVNKLNPFQAQEAQKDAQARRFIAMKQLKESGEYEGMVAEVSMLGHDKLAEEYVDMVAEELYLEALNEIDLEEEFREQQEAIERASELVEGDADSPDGLQVSDLAETWMAKLQDIQKSKQSERLNEVKSLPRKELEEMFLERWREVNTSSEFQREHRVTQIYYAMRVCKATQVGEAWDHSGCNHGELVLKSRSEVKDLPDGLVNQVMDKLDELSVPVRAAGNSDAPTSSSESSELSSTGAADSTPSTPDEMPPVAPTT